MAKRLDVVIVSDGYGDFLETTLPYTKLFADNIVVATGMDDTYTQKVCKKNDVTCVPTYVHKYNDTFNKALAINHGLAHLALDSWILHLDADIVVPPGFKRWFNEAHLLDNTIYGVDRFNCSYDQWLQIEATDWLFRTREWGFMIDPPSNLRITPPVKLGSRIGHGSYHGWVPIGFFQLWAAKHKNRYPLKQQSDMEHTDLLQSAHFPPNQRRLIPDFFALHLVTTNQHGANWAGRKSPAWGNPSLSTGLVNYDTGKIT